MKKKSSQAAKEATTLDDVMSQFNLSAIAASAGVLGLLKAVNGLVSGLGGLAKQSIQAYSHFESMQKGLETFFQSADKGKQKFDELRKFSNETTFGVDELANAFTQLANVGADVDTITNKLTMIGNISGGDKQKFADLISIYSKILSTGKAGSEQIQMLAMRGVPIYDMLKKIGVQGSATGEQITKAFQEMTKEGGQFYNAMNNVNDTIEGKEGFISDYFKEMMNNFAEASGIAEVYKSVLDTVKEVLGGVVDWLFEVNNNPVSKMIFQGTLAAAIAGIAALIGGALITAISTLNKNLAITALLKSVLDPKTLVIAAAVAGIAGLAVAVGNLANEWKNAKNAVEDYNNAVPKTEGENTPKTTKENYQDDYAKAKAEYDKIFKRYNNLINEKVGLLQSAQGKVGWAFQNEQVAESDLKYIDELNKKISKLIVPLENAREKMEALGNILKEIQSGEDFGKRIETFNNSIAEKYDNTDYGKTEAQIKTARNNLDELRNEYANLIKDYNAFKEANKDNKLVPEIDDVEKSKVDRVIQEWQKKLENMKIKFNVDNQNDWQKALSKILGFSDKQISALSEKGYTGNSAADLYRQNQQKNLDSMKNAYGTMGFSFDKNLQMNYYTDLFNEIKSKMLELWKSDDFNPSVDDAVFNNLKTQLDAVAEKLKDFGISVDEAGNLTTDYGSYAKQTGLSAAGSALGDTDAGTFVQTFAQTGNVFIAIINTVIGAIFKVLSSCDGFEDSLNGVTDLFMRFKPILQILVNIVNDIVDGIDGLLNIINVIVAILTPVFQIISMFVKVLQVPLKIIGALFSKLANLMKPVTNAIQSVLDALDNFLSWLDDDDKKEEEEKQTVDLRDAYKSLLEAMKANAEEYEKRKKELNSSDYASKVTGVHDMILTPQGNFSTDPDDYIIATKNPGELNRGGLSVVQLQPVINNTIADTANVQTRTETDSNGIPQLIVTISRKIASDYANGANGWDSAVSARSYRQNGRSLAL